MGIALTSKPNWIIFPEENGKRVLPENLSSILDIPGVTIDSVLGQGTMGVVVTDSTQNKAYKILSPSAKALGRLQLRKQTLEDIFRKEAALVTTSSHLVPRTYGQTSSGQLYIEMPVGEEATIDQLSRNPIESITSVAQGISDYQRDTSNVYFDIKPENLVYLDGQLRVADLSTPTICAELGDEGRVRHNIGSMYTRAPEVYHEGNKPQFQSDVFGLGSLLFKLKTGKYITEDEIDELDKNPDQVREFYDSFDSKSWEKFIKKKCKKNEIDKGLTKILLNSMALDVQERYQVPSDLIHAIKKGKSKENLRIASSIIGLTLLASSSLFLLEGRGYRHQQPTGYVDKTDVNIIRTGVGPSFHYEKLGFSLEATPQINIPLEVPNQKFGLKSLTDYDSERLVLSPLLHAMIQSYKHTKKEDFRFDEFGGIYPQEYLKEKKSETRICSQAGCFSTKYREADFYVYSDDSSPDSFMNITSLRGEESKLSTMVNARHYLGDYSVRNLMYQIRSKVTKGGSFDIEDFLVEAKMGTKALKELKKRAESDYYSNYREYIFPEERKFIEVWRNNLLKILKPNLNSFEEGSYEYNKKTVQYFNFPKKED
jgi:serine/threonine protein kinase